MSTQRACLNCERALRPWKTTADGHPGTLRTVARGMCATCYRKSRDDYPTIEQRRDEQLDDVAELLSYGEYPERIAARLGWSLEAIAAKAYSSGRLDVARPFWSVLNKQRNSKKETK